MQHRFSHERECNLSAADSNQIKGRRGGARPGAGRPKGRRLAKTIEIETAAKAFAGDALKALVHVALHGHSEGSRVTAAVALLDRGYGRPRQALEHSGPEGGPIELTRTIRVPVVELDANEWALKFRGTTGTPDGHTNGAATNGHHNGASGNGK